MLVGLACHFGVFVFVSRLASFLMLMPVLVPVLVTMFVVNAVGMTMLMLMFVTMLVLMFCTVRRLLRTATGRESDTC